MLVSCGNALFVRTAKLRPFLAAFAVATFDAILLEPVMVKKLGYWVWKAPGPLPGGAPVHNAVGWFLVALLASFFIHPSPKKSNLLRAGWVLALFAGFCFVLLLAPVE
jgi:uncharacterized membrane protein